MPKSLRNSMFAVAALFIVIGLALVIWPVQARLAICYTFGALFVLFALVCFAFYFASRTTTGFLRFGVAAGIVSAVVGLVLLFKANAVSTVAGVIIGVAIIAESILRLQVALDARRMGESWLLPLIFSLVMLVIGVVLMFNPFASINVATVVAGCALITDGILSLWSTLAVGKLFRM